MSDGKPVEIDADRVPRIACPKCGYHTDLEGMEPFSIIKCLECGEKQEVPLRLGSFLLLEQFGQGGMGAVYRAYDETLGRMVAIKVMHKSLAEDKQFSANFLREARSAAALNHPNVVHIYSCGQQRGQLYIVMELVDGGRLDQMIADGKAIDEVHALEIAMQVSEGLQAANDIGLIHGDIKPANILFGRNNQAKVVDFGLARFLDKSAHPGEIWGTPYYIAPEKAKGEQEDHRADIYSLGATLFHALSGQPPFDGDTAKDVVLARLHEPAANLSSIRPSLQPETTDVIARMLEADPGLRYPTYKSLQADLREALRVARINEGGAEEAERRTSRTLVIAGVLIVGLVGLGVFAVIQRDVEEPPPPTPVVTPPHDPGDPDPPTPPTPPEIVYEVQPFTAEHEEAIVEAAAAFAGGRPGDMEAKLQELFVKLPRTGVERPWIGVLQAVPAWVEDRERDMLRHLRGIQDATLRELEGDQEHPGAMPQTLARLIVGQVTPEEVLEEAEKWPDWYGALARYFISIHRIKNNQIDAGRKDMEAYAGTEDREAAWPYAFQPHAEGWLGLFKAWDDMRRVVAEADPRDGLDALQAFQDEAAWFLKDQVETEISRVETRIRELERLEELQRVKEHQEKVQADLDRIDQLRDENRSLLSQKEFRRAALDARRLATRLNTEEGRKTLEFLRESYERMDDIKQLLINGIGADPFRERVAPELGGDAVAATSRGIRISLGDHGTVMRDWRRVSERIMVTLADYYLDNTELDDGERAELTLSLAVYCYQNRGFQPARMYAEKAVELNPGLETKVRKLMPDILPG